MPKKIKILFAINTLSVGGAPSVVFEQIKNIDKSEFDPYLLTLYPSKQANFFSRIDFLKADKIVNFNLKNRSIFDLKTLYEIYKFLKKEKFDVICTHLFLSSLIVRFINIISISAKVFVYEHSFCYNRTLWQKISDNILSRFSDKIITPNKQIADFISKQERIPLSKFVCVPNPVSLPEKNDGIVNNLKKELKYEDDKFYVLSIGRFNEEKGQKFMVDAAEILLSKGMDFKVLLVGHGPQEMLLRNYITGKKMEKVVSIVKEPLLAKYFFELADIFVLSSLKEGQPIALMEAMRFGVPVIASSTDGSRTIIKDGINGLFFKVGDAKDLAGQIEKVYKNEKLRGFLAENAKKSVSDFSPEINIKKLEELIYKSFKTHGKL